MKASEQLAKWISSENDLYGSSQDEILKLVFQYPAVASYKLMLAKWQFLRHGAVEEGLWQQLLLQWPNSAQLFEWRNKGFDFNKADKIVTYQSPELIDLFSEEIPTHDQPNEKVWSWGQYFDEMEFPVSFVWAIPAKAVIAEMEELPVFDFLLQTESELDAEPDIEEFKITEDPPIIKEEETFKENLWNWAAYIDENLDHIFSVGISENLLESKKGESMAIKMESQPITSTGKDVFEVSTTEIQINDIFSEQSTFMDLTEDFHPSAFVQWLQNHKQLQIKEQNHIMAVKQAAEGDVMNAEKELNKPKPEKEKFKEKNKEKDKHKKKDKKKKKQKKKEKLEEEIFSSLEFSDDVASETYAALLAKQGHYELSERIYERLRLIYPEKSSYFAGLIKKLKS